jgi:hypothetical protein
MTAVSMKLEAFANTLAAALSELRSMGFSVTKQNGSSYVAEGQGLTLCGDDVLQLLALAILSERRGGAACHPTDVEVQNLVSLEQSKT